MATAKRWQSMLRSSLPIMDMSPANGAGFPDGGDVVNWLWLNIPLMAAFFAAMTGIPLWLVLKHPDHGPAASQPAARGRQARPPATVHQPAPVRQPAVHPQPALAYLPSNRDRYAQVGR
jgi:hypothetical protein